MQVLQAPRIGKSATLTPGSAAVIFDEHREKILLTRRSDNGKWCLPGGRMEPGESAAEACIREVFEETGLNVEVIKLIGIYTSPHMVITYANTPGKLLQLVSMCFEARISGGTLGLSNETTDFGWFTPDQTATMDLVEHHPQRITDALANRAQAFVR